MGAVDLGLDMSVIHARWQPLFDLHGYCIVTSTYVGGCFLKHALQRYCETWFTHAGKCGGWDEIKIVWQVLTIRCRVVAGQPFANGDLAFREPKYSGREISIAMRYSCCLSSHTYAYGCSRVLDVCVTLTVHSSVSENFRGWRMFVFRR